MLGKQYASCNIKSVLENNMSFRQPERKHCFPVYLSSNFARKLIKWYQSKKNIVKLITYMKLKLLFAKNLKIEKVEQN